jgi:hypothetical protein
MCGTQQPQSTPASRTTILIGWHIVFVAPQTSVVHTAPIQAKYIYFSQNQVDEEGVVSDVWIDQQCETRAR